MADKNVIVMGDMNDTPATPVINRLRGFDDIWVISLQTANAVEVDNRYTYIHEGEKICSITSSSVQVYGMSFAVLRGKTGVKLLMSAGYQITALFLHGCGLSILLLCLRQTKGLLKWNFTPMLPRKLLPTLSS